MEGLSVSPSLLNLLFKELNFLFFFPQFLFYFLTLIHTIGSCMWRMVKYGKPIFKDITPMANDRVNSPQFHSTMERLEALRHVTSGGVEFWMARQIDPVLGYEVWARFLNVIGRVKISFTNNRNRSSSHHIAQTSKMMGVGRGAQVEGNDFYLSRAACYLLAMNGDPSKAEIAAAQAYFAIKTRDGSWMSKLTISGWSFARRLPNRTSALIK